MLRSHYRSPLEVTEATTADAAAALERLDAFARRVRDLPASPPDGEAVVQLQGRMDDDLDTPGVVDLLFRLVRRANAALDEGDQDAAAPLAAAVGQICRAVGLELHDEDAELPEWVTAKAAERDEARAARDWPRADALRDELEAEGYLVEDTPQGTQVRPK